MGGAEMEGRFEGASCSARSCSVELPRPTLFICDPNGLYFSCSIDSILLSVSTSSHYSGPVDRDQGLYKERPGLVMAAPIRLYQIINMPTILSDTDKASLHGS